MENNIRELRFKTSQRGVGEDVYYCKANGRCYIRQETNIEDPPTVFWLSCTKGRDGCGWSGYEASAPLRAGLIMRVMNADGTVAFEEVIEQNSWNQDTHAKKVGAFSWEKEREGRKDETRQ